MTCDMSVTVTSIIYNKIHIYDLVLVLNNSIVNQSKTYFNIFLL